MNDDAVLHLMQDSFESATFLQLCANLFHDYMQLHLIAQKVAFFIIMYEFIVSYYQVGSWYTSVLFNQNG